MNCSSACLFVVCGCWAEKAQICVLLWPWLQEATCCSSPCFPRWFFMCHWMQEQHGRWQGCAEGCLVRPHPHLLHPEPGRANRERGRALLCKCTPVVSSVDVLKTGNIYIHRAYNVLWEYESVAVRTFVQFLLQFQGFCCCLLCFSYAL